MQKRPIYIQRDIQKRPIYTQKDMQKRPLERGVAPWALRFGTHTKTATKDTNPYKKRLIRIKRDVPRDMQK